MHRPAYQGDGAAQLLGLGDYFDEQLDEAFSRRH